MVSVSIAHPPTIVSVFVEWSPDYLSAAAALVVAGWYIGLRRKAAQHEEPWKSGRDLVFGFGIAAMVWTSCGYLQARSGQLMWAWTAQQLLLLLVVPIIVLAAQPISLARTVNGQRSHVARVLGSRPLRVLGNPLVGPLLVPILCWLLFFGGLGRFALSSVMAAGVVHLLLLGIGGLIALPLVDSDDRRSSLAIGASLGIGALELIIDAFPGLVLRYQTHLVLPHFGVGRPGWSSSWLDDQHIAGGTLWVVAELLDLPFLILAATRWTKADARGASAMDAELDARRPVLDDGTEPATDKPWWLDPEQRSRLGR